MSAGVLLLSPFFALVLCGQTALVTGPGTVSVLDKDVSVQLTPAALSPRLSVVVALDTFESSELDALKAFLRKLYLSRKDKALFALEVFSSGNFQVLGPHKSMVAFDKDLKEQLRKPGETTGIDALRFYDALLRSLHSTPDDEWLAVVYAARWPDLPDAVRDYAQACLTRAFGARHVRPVFWSPGNSPVPPFLDSISRQFQANLENSTPDLQVVTWSPPQISDGFFIVPATFKSDAGLPVEEWRDFVQKPGFPLPSLEDYQKLRQAVQTRAPLNELMAALAVNPRDPEGVRLAADEALQAKNHEAASLWLAAVVELEPDNGDRWCQYANALFDRGPILEAESAIARARQLNPRDANLVERAGRIRLLRRDVNGTLAAFDDSLALNPKNEDLWWISADLAREIKDKTREIRSLEKALALNGSRLDRRTRLVSLLLESKDLERARPYVETVGNKLPPEVPVLADYARFWEQLGQPAQSLELWRRTFAVTPGYEPGYFESTRLLMAAGKDREGLETADAGLTKAPASARLHLTRADLLERLGQPYDSRRELESSAAKLEDLSLLRRRAGQEDLYGKVAAEAYQKLSQFLEKTNAPPADLAAVDQRGLSVSLRDNDAERSAWFRTRIKQREGERPPVWKPKLTNQLTLAPTTVIVPGGLAGLAFAAHMAKTSSSATFFYEFSRTLVDRFRAVDKKAVDMYRDELLTYFTKVRQLEGFGKRQGEHSVIHLSVKDKNARQATERVVEFLGYKLKVSKGKISLDAGEKKEQGRRQELLSALGLDPVGMEEAIEAGKDYDLEVDTGSASVLFGESTWFREFAPKGPPPGGFAELLVREPSVAKIYAGLSAAEPYAAEQIAKRIGLRNLSGEKYADLLFAFGPALATNNKGESVVPGGDAARSVWRSLVQTDTKDPATFYFQLLVRDNGRQLAFFSNLTQLDPLRQTFFTRTPERLAAYYGLFKDSPEMKQGAPKRSRDASFLEFLREIPVGKDGSVLFPGSPEVWTVAKGTSNLEKTQKLIRKVDKAVAPATEDEILIRMARRRYEVGALRVSQMDNFLAVARIDGRRASPLTEAEALLLAQSLIDCEGAYPYFATFTELHEKDFTRFLRMAARVKELKEVEANHLLAHFYSVAELLDILQRHEFLIVAESSALFSELCDKLSGTPSASTWAEASAAVLEAMRQKAKVPAGTAEPGTWWIDVLAGHPQLGRRDEIRKVLQAQKAPDLAAVLEMLRQARNVATKPKEAAAALEKGYAALPRADFGKNQKPKNELRRMVELYNSPNGAKLVAEVKKRAAKKKPNPKDFVKLSAELLDDLAGPLALAALSLDYAYFLRPSDLAAMEDPMLVRKHQFLELDSPTKMITRFPYPDLVVQGETIGSYAYGSMAGFAVTAGKIARAGQVKSDSHCEVVQVMQTAALRSAPLWQLRVDDFRSFKLRVLAGREWIVESSRNAETRQQLEQATVGLVAPNRRSRLIGALDAGEVAPAWEILSLGDLYWLGDRLSRGDPNQDLWPSPLWAALRGTKPVHHQLLGPVPLYIHGYSWPTFEPLPPYEDYERYMLPERLSERVSEFKLSLAWLVDHEGLEPLRVAAAAEGLMEKAFTALQMTDSTDWASALKAWSSVDASWLTEKP